MICIHLLLASALLVACNGDGTDVDPDDLIDTDGDGLSDAEEADYGTDPTLADTDYDGYGDLEEIEYGTDPNDIFDHPYNAGWAMDIECRHSIVPTHEDDSDPDFKVGDIVNNFESFSQMGDNGIPEYLRLHDFCDHHVLLVSSAFG